MQKDFTVETTPGQSRRERERQQHRDEILDAAEQLFSSKGFHATTMEEVAGQAEFAVGTLYNFFASKEVLYTSLIEDRARRLHADALESLASVEEPLDVIRTFVSEKVRLYEKHHRFIRLYTRERMGDRFTRDALWTERIGPLLEDVMGRVTEAFRAGAAAGTFRADLEPHDMATALEGLTDGFLYEALERDSLDSLGEKTASMTRIFLDGVTKR